MILQYVYVLSCQFFCMCVYVCLFVFIFPIFYLEYGGPPDPLHGNVPYAMVRKEAKVGLTYKILNTKINFMVIVRKCIYFICQLYSTEGNNIIHNISYAVDPLSYFSLQPVLHDWCNKGHGMCYPVCGMVHIKEPLLLIDKSSLCGGSRFSFSLSEWSLTICLTPYNRR